MNNTDTVSPDISEQKCKVPDQNVNNNENGEITANKENVVCSKCVNIHIYTNNKKYRHTIYKEDFKDVNVGIYIASIILCISHCVVCILFMFINIRKYLFISINSGICLLSLYYNKNIASRKLVGIRWWACIYIWNNKKPLTCFEIRGLRKKIKGRDKIFFVGSNILPIICYIIEMLYIILSFNVFLIVKIIEISFFIVLSITNLIMCGIGRSIHLHYIINNYRLKKVNKSNKNQVNR